MIFWFAVHILWQKDDCFIGIPDRCPSCSGQSVLPANHVVWHFYTSSMDVGASAKAVLRAGVPWICLWSSWPRDPAGRRSCKLKATKGRTAMQSYTWLYCFRNFLGFVSLLDGQRAWELNWAGPDEHRAQVEVKLGLYVVVLENKYSTWESDGPVKSI